MQNLRINGLIGAGVFLVVWDLTAAGDISQGWTLSKPNPTVQGLQSQTKKESLKAPIRDYERSDAFYSIPSVQVVDKEGNDIDFRQLLDYGGPIMIQFIFVTCSTVCPILSASFASAQSELDTLAGGSYRLISISIDPDQDTHEKLNEYAERFKAGKNWYFLTGERDNIFSILKSFDANYAGNNKMYHKSLTLMRSSFGANWIRLEGLLSKNDIIREYKNLIDLSGQPKD